jgi:hypothetical protein
MGIRIWLFRELVWFPKYIKRSFKRKFDLHNASQSLLLEWNWWAFQEQVSCPYCIIGSMVRMASIEENSNCKRIVSLPYFSVIAFYFLSMICKLCDVGQKALILNCAGQQQQRTLKLISWKILWPKEFLMILWSNSNIRNLRFRGWKDWFKLEKIES